MASVVKVSASTGCERDQRQYRRIYTYPRRYGDDRVVDNGGIHPDDMVMAIIMQPVKSLTLPIYMSISTLGFR
jgi:hypothetical protein